MNKLIFMLLIPFLMISCSKTVKVENEGTTKTGMIEEIPKWYSEKVDKKGFLGKKDQFYIYGVGVATSPDLQLAMDKASMIAKADIADVLHGEMNKQAQTYIQEIGQGDSKETVTETQSTIINLIKNIKVQGYEHWKVTVSITPNQEYRVYMGLQLPLGEYNKLADMIEEEATAKLTNELNSLSKGNEAFEDLNDKISSVELQ